jgi:translation initiation factor 3 subunit I
MRPILLKGHERPLTFIKYNREGDLLFTCAKDHHPTLWSGLDGERIGTYIGHNGAVWTCDVTDDSSTLITGSADTTCKLWNVETGECVFTFAFDQPVRAVAVNIGGTAVAITTDPFMGVPSAIHVVKLNCKAERNSQSQEVLKRFDGPQGRITRVMWGPLNQTLITGGEDGIIRSWDVETGEVVKMSQDHSKQVQHLVMSLDRTHFISASLDKTAKVFDSETLECLKTYAADRPVNAAILSPIRDHIILGGGQDAMAVTTTSSKAGKFDSKIYHKIYEEEIGGIRGHFGPINALAFNPDGRSFTSGGEDGYVRVHPLDQDYFSIK